MWVKNNQEEEKHFLSDLETMMLEIPMIGFACVIDRQGYTDRYKEKYGQPWLMCKTAFSIIVERVAKYVQGRKGTFEIFFEQAGKIEDENIKNYMKDIKRDGQPFSKEGSDNYDALSVENLKSIIKGEPREQTKQSPPIQLADLMLYPMVKGGYDKTYAPYRILLEKGRLIDSLLDAKGREKEGIKYSCFDNKK